MFKANGKCYYHYEALLNYDVAISECKNRFGPSAILAEPMNQQELVDIDASVQNKDWYLWIGVNDRETEGNFVYESSNLPAFTRWESGQPNAEDAFDCVLIHPDTGLMRALPCNLEAHFLCQF